MEDRELVNKVIINGDTKNFAVIVSRYSGMVFSKALGLTCREELAAEVAQQTFIKAYENLACWRGQTLAPWLAAIASHISLNIIDKEKRRRAEPIGQMALPADDGNGGYSAEHEEMLVRMERAIDRLPDADRRLIELHYYKHLSTKEIAADTGLSMANVLVRLHRIRERLKKQIENERDE